MTAASTIDAYIAAQPEASRETLGRVRAAIRKAAPEAVETISYQIPAYRMPGGMLIYFAGWKEHWSLYPATPGVVAGLGDALAGLTVSKGTIRFPLSKPVPVRLVGQIVRIRLADVAAAAEAKKTKKAKTATTAKTAKKPAPAKARR